MSTTPRPEPTPEQLAYAAAQQIMHASPEDLADLDELIRRGEI